MKDANLTIILTLGLGYGPGLTLTPNPTLYLTLTLTLTLTPHPSKAAEGFCKKNGLALADVVREKDEKGVEYLFATVQEKVRKKTLNSVSVRTGSRLLCERLSFSPDFSNAFLARYEAALMRQSAGQSEFG